MHSFWQRLNAIFFYSLSVLGFLAFAAAGTTFWHESDPKINISLKKIMLRKISGAGHDQAIISLALDADLRSVFNWNVKQLFVYVTAEYETEANVRCCSTSHTLLVATALRSCPHSKTPLAAPPVCLADAQPGCGLGPDHLRARARVDTLQLGGQQVLINRPGLRPAWQQRHAGRQLECRALDGAARSAA